MPVDGEAPPGDEERSWLDRARIEGQSAHEHGRVTAELAEPRASSPSAIARGMPRGDPPPWRIAPAPCSRASSLHTHQWAPTRPPRSTAATTAGIGPAPPSGRGRSPAGASFALSAASSRSLST